MAVLEGERLETIAFTFSLQEDMAASPTQLRSGMMKYFYPELINLACTWFLLCMCACLSWSPQTWKGDPVLAMHDPLATVTGQGI